MLNAQLVFGCEIADLEWMLKDNIGPKEMLAMSILSDSQEEMERGNIETARQYVNRAKWVMQQMLRERR